VKQIREELRNKEEKAIALTITVHKNNKRYKEQNIHSKRKWIKVPFIGMYAFKTSYTTDKNRMAPKEGILITKLKDNLNHKNALHSVKYYIY
jgi:hypothetical protein